MFHKTSRLLTYFNYTFVSA